jgi:uncharacterized protein (TIGR03643 family)
VRFDCYAVAISDLTKLDDRAINRIIALAWADRVPFEEIEAKTGLRESDVIVTMRRHLKPKSFRIWRARVSGRGTKHQKRFRKDQKMIHLQTHEALHQTT